MKNSSARFLLSLALLAAPLISRGQAAQMPPASDFKVGDRWEWRQLDDRTGLEERKFARTVIDVDGAIQFTNGLENYQISALIIDGGYLHSDKPWRVWPLEVGKKWRFEGEWARSDSATGNTRQDVEVVAYEEVVVPAGKFMAFRIEHHGFYQNARRRSGQQNDTYWYAPEARADVKHHRDDGHNLYTRELLSYKPAPR